jgi:PPM family protein phosphatase
VPPQSAPELLVAARTDPGCDPAKAVNEDAYLATRRPDATLLVVCDGMGGHEGGRVASNTAIQVLKSLFEASLPASGHARYLRQLIETAGRAVHALASGEESELRPGSTCVAMLFTSAGVAIAHAGDSRAYLLRGGAIERLTQDHSVINDLVMAGIMSPTEAKNHPDAHRITRALGMNAQVVVDVREVHDIRTSDQFLLCSDGLTDLVDDIEIARILGGSRQDDVERASTALIDLAKQRGGHDNVTVVVAHVVASGTGQPEARELLPTESDVSSSVPTTKVDVAQLQPTIALTDPRDARVAPTVVESALRAPSGTETVPLAIPQGPVLEPTTAGLPQAAGTNIKWDTSHRDDAATPRSVARFMLIAAIVSGLVIVGLLFWAILR